MSDRRNFIRTSLMAAAGIAASDTLLAKPLANLQNKPKKKTKGMPANQQQLQNVNGLKTLLVKGKVTSVGYPLQDVVISDGLNCTTTDKDGTYSLLTDIRREYLFMSIPSGQKIPVFSNYIPEFSYPISKIDEKEPYVEFRVIPEEGDDKKHNFLLLADPQVLDDKDLQRFYAETVYDIKDFINEQKLTNVFSVGCGDIVYDHLELYEQFKQYYSIAKVPFFAVPGNHDTDKKSQSDEGSSETFQNQMAPRYYSFNKGEVHYVVLDDVFYHGSGYIGYLEKDQMDWLKNDLSYIPKGKTVILFTHIPPYNTEHTRLGESKPRVSTALMNREGLYKLLDGYKSYIITGHMHEMEFIKDGGAEIHVCGAVCGAWWTADICGDGTPNGYMVYSVDGDKLTWQYKATKKPFDHQIRIFNELNTDKKRVLANVWGANKDWKINLYADGQKKGEMTQILDKDPLSQSLFDGPELPKKHKWVDSYINYHMYEYKLESAAQNIVVEAVSDQGKTFTQTL